MRTGRMLLVLAGWMAVAGPVALGQGDAAPVPCAPPPVKDVAGLQVPALEVVSVKQNKSGGGSASGGVTEAGLSISNMPLGLLIQMAYGTELAVSGPMTGMPDWAGKEHYDIEGKVSEADASKLADRCQRNLMVRPMLRAVLVERFHLQVHRESKEVPAYALVVAKSGVKMKQAAPGDQYATGITAPNGRPDGPGAVWMSRDRITGQAISMGTLAPVLSRGAGRTVIDKTELTGKYDVDLHWAPDQGAPKPDDGAPAVDTGPSFFTAIQEQSGLRLEPTKTTMEIYVVDHVERPTEN